MNIRIHTDGSCNTQTRIGGWAAILSSGAHQKILSGQADDTTVNAMELTAAIEGLRAIKQPGAHVEIVSDSTYLVKGASEWLADWIGRGWKTAANKPVANAALWQQLHGLMGQHDVTFTWVPRGQNTDADTVAQSARKQTPQPPPVTHETHVAIIGTGFADRKARDYARKLVRRAHKQGYTVLVGDNPQGVDMAVVLECRKLKAKVVVVGTTARPRNGGCPHGDYVRIERDTYRGPGGSTLGKWTVRDRWMIDNAQIGVFLWNGTASATRDAYEYARARGKDAHFISFAKAVRHG